MTKFSAQTWSRYGGYQTVSTLPQRPAARAPRLRPPNEDFDRHEVSAAWEAYVGRTHPRVKVRTAAGPRWAHVIRREGSWVVTVREGGDEVRLTHGPLGMAVAGVESREACLGLLEAIVAAGHRDAAGVSTELGAVIKAWVERRDAPAANEPPPAAAANG